MRRLMIVLSLVAMTAADATAGPLRRLFCRPNRPAPTACQSAPVRQRPAYLPATLPVANAPAVFAGPVPTLIRQACAGGVCPR